MNRARRSSVAKSAAQRFDASTGGLCVRRRGASDVRSSSIVVAAGLLACAARMQRISVLPSQPALGDAYASCEFDGNDLVVFVSASCVVDSEKRIVVSNLATDEIVFDTKQSKTPVPNFPVDQFVPVRLPCRCGESLQSSKQLLLVSLSGKCGQEHAAGAFRCVTGSGAL